MGSDQLVYHGVLIVLLGVVLEVAQLLIGGKYPELRDSVLVDQHIASAVFAARPAPR
jgi:hypothetical protein